MLRWREVKPLIGEIVGARLRPMGFVNPGRAMWRYREHFVDVVAFRCERYGQGFSFEFGCALRKGVRLHPEPPRCDFRTYDLEIARSDGFRPYIPFADDVAAQRDALEALSPAIVEEATMWFAHFASFETVVETVMHHPARFIFGAPKGSLGKDVALKRLRDAMEP